MIALREMRGICLLLFCAGVIALAEPADVKNQQPAKARDFAPQQTATAMDAPLKTIGDGIFEIGKVRFDKTKRTISFDASVNMDNGPVEYLLVSSIGKLHESVLRTEAEPSHIQVAALLLKQKTTATESGAGADPSLVGDEVRIRASWKNEDHSKEIPAEDLVFNLEAKAVMNRGPWVYNGSRIHDGSFLAQRDGSIVAIIADPDALVNNPRPGRDQDEIWQPSTNTPPVGTRVAVTIAFETGDQRK